MREKFMAHNYTISIMNDITRAGLIFNAANIPLGFFMKLCNDYDPHEIFTGAAFLQELGLSDAQFSRVTELLAKDSWAERELEMISRHGARFITAKDLDYPTKLLDLKRPPVGLYIKGKANISLPSIAIVGTRSPGSYGQTTAGNLARELARHGAMTISGGAAGIDSAAHRGSLGEDWITIAVFGTSIDRVYPFENRDLFERIIERGAVISEYPAGTPGESWHFPERNRLIAALSSRVVIVEAGEKSGALITARYAQELGRELWAVPGRITDENSRGTNSLLNHGAKCLYDIAEFTEDFTGKHEQLELFADDADDSEDTQATKYTAPEMSDDEKVIYSLLQKKGSRLLDELITDSGIDAVDVQTALMMLQAEGLVNEALGRYSAAN